MHHPSDTSYRVWVWLMRRVQGFAFSLRATCSCRCTKTSPRKRFPAKMAGNVRRRTNGAFPVYSTLQGTAGIRRDPFARDLLFDPGGTTVSRVPTLHMLRSAISDSLRSRGFIISWLYRRPHATAVYASCSALPPPHATLASRRLARPYLCRTCTG